MPALDGFGVMSRRRWLALSLGAGGLVLSGGAAALYRLRGRAAPVSGLLHLSAHEYRTLTLLAAALFPRGGAFALGAAAHDLGRDFDQFLDGEPEYNRVDLKRALLLLEYGPVIFERRWTTFSALTEADRLAHYIAWATGDDLVRRQAALAFRKFLGTVFYDRPEVWPDIGYTGAAAARWAK